MTADTTETAAGHQAVRKACHNILYTIANSSALDNAASGVYGWLVVLTGIDIVILGLFVLYYVKRHFKMKRWKAAQMVVEEKEQ